MNIVQDMYAKFIAGCVQNGHDPKTCENIWDGWQAVAPYAFIKSHAACYAYIAYQTAYLKAHYPVEFDEATSTGF